jgi:hypothetical protein
LPGKIQAGDTENINAKWQVATGYGLTLCKGHHDKRAKKKNSG